MNMNFFDSEIHFVSQISQPRGIAQKWFCIQYLRMDLSFQQKQTVCKSVPWFLRYEAKSKVIIFFGTPCIFFILIIILRVISLGQTQPGKLLKQDRRSLSQPSGIKKASK